MNEACLEYIQQYVPKENILLNEPMSRHTTFRAGGEAKCFIEIEKAEQLTKLVPYFQQVEMPYYLIGNGSNLLTGDKGFQGTIFHLGPRFSTIRAEGTRITADAGALLSQVAQYALGCELSGLEFAAGIPGSIGGAMVMNAGAYGGEMKQVVECVRVLDADGNIMDLSNDDMDFGYRTSIIKRRPFVVLQAVFNLEHSEYSRIQHKMKELSEKRRQRQPLEYPSAGSTFKRPQNNFAGKLIMDAGLRGFRIGGAQVSEKHCGFIINVGNATAADISEVMSEVIERVEAQFDVKLEPEVILLGDF